MIIGFLESLEIKSFSTITHENQITIFDLWKFGKDKNGACEIYEKQSNGQWVKKENSDCTVPLYLNTGFIEMPSMNSFNMEDMTKFEYRIKEWSASFSDAVILKLKVLFRQKYGNKVVRNIHEVLDCFVQEVIKRSNYEDYSLKVCQLHHFFDTEFSIGQRLLNGLNDQILIKNLINLNAKDDVHELFSKYLPKHLALLRVIDSKTLITMVPEIKREAKNLTPTIFASYILKSIDDVLSYTKDDYEFLVNISGASLSKLVEDKENFILWVKFFAAVSNSIQFEKIESLYDCFMRIGLKRCVKNKAYIEKIFQYFQRRQYQSNTYDLEYALNYSLIENCLNWQKQSNKNLDNFIYDFEDSILSVRKNEIVNGFVQLSDQGLIRFNKSSVKCKETKRLWENCLILCGISHVDNESSSVSFTVYQDADHTLLLGGSLGFGESISLYMETLVGGDNFYYLRKNCENYFNKVMEI